MPGGVPEKPVPHMDARPGRDAKLPEPARTAIRCPTSCWESEFMSPDASMAKTDGPPALAA